MWDHDGHNCTRYRTMSIRPGRYSPLAFREDSRLSCSLPMSSVLAMVFLALASAHPPPSSPHPLGALPLQPWAVGQLPPARRCPLPRLEEPLSPVRPTNPPPRHSWIRRPAHRSRCTARTQESRRNRDQTVGPPGV